MSDTVINILRITNELTNNRKVSGRTLEKNLNFVDFHLNALRKMCYYLSIGIKSPNQITKISQSRNIFSIVHCYHFLAQFNISKAVVFKTFVLKFTAYIMVV